MSCLFSCVFTEEKGKPLYYKVKPQNETEGEEFCLATGFTDPDATDLTWSPKTYKTEAVRFEGEGYYSRFNPDVKKCNETGKNLYTTHALLYNYTNIF